MNGQMGVTNSSSNPTWRTYTKGSDLACPKPADAFVFLDESPASLNDGYFQLSLSTPNLADIPAAYLDGGCGFAFADGHAEIHRWQTPALLAVPVVHGLTVTTLTPVGGANADWIWIRQHAACHQ